MILTSLKYILAFLVIIILLTWIIQLVADISYGYKNKDWSPLKHNFSAITGMFKLLIDKIPDSLKPTSTISNSSSNLNSTNITN